MKKIPRWMLGWIILVLLVSTIPYFAGLFVAPDGGRFTGNLVSCYDTFSYFADMQLGAQGYWLYRLPYSAESNQAAPLFMLYIFMGHLSRIFHLSVPLVFHAVRIICSALFLFAAARSILNYLENEKEQKLALGILLFTGGIGWLPLVLSGGTVTQEFTPDLWWIEAISFNSILSMPHFTLSMAIMIWMVMAGERFIREACLGDGIRVGIACVLMALIHPQQIIIPGGIFIVLLLTNWCKTIKKMISRSFSLFLFTVPGLVLTVYSTLLSFRDPLLSSWLAQGNTYSPPFWSLFFLYGPILLLALIGFLGCVKEWDDKLLPIVLWFILVLFLIYIPVNYQRRFAEGWHLPVSILASIGWYRYLASIFLKISRSFALLSWCILLVSVGMSSFVVFSATMARLMQIDPGTMACSFDNRDEKAAMSYLQQHGSFDSIVLSDSIYGLKIPAETGLRTILGHETLTPFFFKRVEDVNYFMDPSIDPKVKIDILQKLDVDFVFVTSEEGDMDILGNTEVFELVFENKSFLIYRVE